MKIILVAIAIGSLLLSNCRTPVSTTRSDKRTNHEIHVIEPLAPQPLTTTLPRENVDDNYAGPYTAEMLIDTMNFRGDSDHSVYGHQMIFYGIVKKVDSDLHHIKIRIEKTPKEWMEMMGSPKTLNGSDIDLIVEVTLEGPDNMMGHMASQNLPRILTCGRRLKFSFIEGASDRGSSEIGIFYLTYIQLLKGDSF